MKRSEAVNTLQTFMNGLAESGAGYSAKDIVTYLEYLGMSPPEVAEDVETGVCIMTPMGFQVQRTETSKVFVHKWEPEDAGE